MISSPDVHATYELVADLDRLGDEIAEMSAHLDAAIAQLLDLIREFDARGGWNTGFRSRAAWLSWRIGLDLGAARERVRVARALGTLPRLAHAFARGGLSYAKVRALTRVAQKRRKPPGGTRAALCTCRRGRRARAPSSQHYAAPSSIETVVVASRVVGFLSARAIISATGRAVAPPRCRISRCSVVAITAQSTRRDIRSIDRPTERSASGDRTAPSYLRSRHRRRPPRTPSRFCARDTTRRASSSRAHRSTATERRTCCNG